MNRVLRPFALALAVSAMLMRAVLPLGWMPSNDTHAPLIVCPMMGGIHAPSGKPDVPGNHNHSCPFTASLAQLAAPASPLFLSLPFCRSAARELAAAAWVVFANPYRAQSPRAPPLVA